MYLLCWCQCIEAVCLLYTGWAGASVSRVHWLTDWRCNSYDACLSHVTIVSVWSSMSLFCYLTITVHASSTVLINIQIWIKMSWQAFTANIYVCFVKTLSKMGGFQCCQLPVNFVGRPLELSEFCWSCKACYNFWMHVNIVLSDVKTWQTSSTLWRTSKHVADVEWTSVKTDTHGDSKNNNFATVSQQRCHFIYSGN